MYIFDTYFVFSVYCHLFKYFSKLSLSEKLFDKLNHYKSWSKYICSISFITMKVTLSKRLESNKNHFKLMFTPVSVLHRPILSDNDYVNRWKNCKVKILSTPLVLKLYRRLNVVFSQWKVVFMNFNPILGHHMTPGMVRS